MSHLSWGIMVYNLQGSNQPAYQCYLIRTFPVGIMLLCWGGYICNSRDVLVMKKCSFHMFMKMTYQLDLAVLEHEWKISVFLSSAKINRAKFSCPRNVVGHISKPQQAT